MTKAEFYEKYGEVEVMFESYYKYEFTYQADLPDGKTIVVTYGGDGDKIYRHGVTAWEEVKISVLRPFSGNVYDGGNSIEEFYDY